MISVATTQSCCCCTKTVRGTYKQMSMVVLQKKTLFTKSGNRPEVAHRLYFASSCSVPRSYSTLWRSCVFLGDIDLTLTALLQSSRNSASQRPHLICSKVIYALNHVQHFININKYKISISRKSFIDFHFILRSQSDPKLQSNVLK